MHAVLRTYTGAGAKPLIELLEQRKSEVEALMRSVPGLVSYTFVRTAEGAVTVTVCQDKAGTDESVRVAREWTQKNAPNVTASPPAISEGAVIVHVK